MSGAGKDSSISTAHNCEMRNGNINSLNSSGEKNPKKLLWFLTFPSISLKASKIRIPASQCILVNRDTGVWVAKGTPLFSSSSHLDALFSSLFIWFRFFASPDACLLRLWCSPAVFFGWVFCPVTPCSSLYLNSLSLLLWLQEDIKHITVQGLHGWTSTPCTGSALWAILETRSPFPRPSPGNVHGLSVSCRHGFLLAGYLVHLLLLLCPFRTKIYDATFQPAVWSVIVHCFLK